MLWCQNYIWYVTDNCRWLQLLHLIEAIYCSSALVNVVQCCTLRKTCLPNKAPMVFMGLCCNPIQPTETHYEKLSLIYNNKKKTIWGYAVEMNAFRLTYHHAGISMFIFSHISADTQVKIQEISYCAFKPSLDLLAESWANTSAWWTVQVHI